MSRSFAAPNKYIQRAGEIGRLSAHLAPLGSAVLVLIDRALYDRLAARIGDDLQASGIRMLAEPFGGECTLAEIDRVTNLARSFGADIIVGVGGGKTADTAKIAAYEVGARTVIVPTIASTDAPCSAVAVRYDESGIWEGSARLPRNPDLVVVDTEIVASAPVRFLVAGMGDALSTWFEGRSNLESGALNYVAGGFPPTLTGIAIAHACHDSLMRYGVAAKQSLDAGLLTEAVENIIETNVLLSSIGFENVGCSAAHSIGDGLTAITEASGSLHGEKVAFGTLCQLVLERRPARELEQILTFCEDVGLPTTLAQLGITGDAETLRITAERIAEIALTPGESIHGAPVAVSVEIVRDAILELDAVAGARRLGRTEESSQN